MHERADRSSSWVGLGGGGVTPLKENSLKYMIWFICFTFKMEREEHMCRDACGKFTQKTAKFGHSYWRITSSWNPHCFKKWSSFLSMSTFCHNAFRCKLVIINEFNFSIPFVLYCIIIDTFSCFKDPEITMGRFFLDLMDLAVFDHLIREF